MLVVCHPLLQLREVCLPPLHQTCHTPQTKCGVVVRIHLRVNYNPMGASRGVEGEKEEEGRGGRRKEEGSGERRREMEGGGGKRREERRGGRRREVEGFLKRKACE